MTSIVVTAGRELIFNKYKNRILENKHRWPVLARRLIKPQLGLQLIDQYILLQQRRENQWGIWKPSICSQQGYTPCDDGWYKKLFWWSFVVKIIIMILMIMKAGFLTCGKPILLSKITYTREDLYQGLLAYTYAPNFSNSISSSLSVRSRGKLPT